MRATNFCTVTTAHDSEIIAAVVVAKYRCKVNKQKLMTAGKMMFITELVSEGFCLLQIMNCNAIIIPIWHDAMTVSCHMQP